LRDVTQDKLYREKDTLLAFLSHEIRNPVQAITLGCHLLWGSHKVAEKKKENKKEFN
jgi:signal transduction histidine kinase